MCVGAVQTRRGLQGSGLAWGLVPAPVGPLLSQGLWGVCRGFPGHAGEKGLTEVCAATDPYVYKHI